MAFNEPPVNPSPSCLHTTCQARERASERKRHTQRERESERESYWGWNIDVAASSGGHSFSPVGQLGNHPWRYDETMSEGSPNKLLKGILTSQLINYILASNSLEKRIQSRASGYDYFSHFLDESMSFTCFNDFFPIMHRSWWYLGLFSGKATHSWNKDICREKIDQIYWCDTQVLMITDTYVSLVNHFWSFWPVMHLKTLSPLLHCKYFCSLCAKKRDKTHSWQLS